MIRVLTVIGLATVVSGSGVLAQETGSSCILVKRVRFDEFFTNTRPQPVFRNGEAVGWRVYEPEALKMRGLQPQDLVTHFCGIEVHQIAINDGDICCVSPVGVSVAVVVEREGRPIRVMAMMPPNKPLEPTR